MLASGASAVATTPRRPPDKEHAGLTPRAHRQCEAEHHFLEGQRIRNMRSLCFASLPGLA